MGVRKWYFCISPSHFLLIHMVRKEQHHTILLGMQQRKRSILNNGQPFDYRQNKKIANGSDEAVTLEFKVSENCTILKDRGAASLHAKEKPRAKSIETSRNSEEGPNCPCLFVMFWPAPPGISNHVSIAQAENLKNTLLVEDLLSSFVTWQAGEKRHSLARKQDEISATSIVYNKPV